MATPQLTPETMERLAFIRMLHHQGIEQSRLPEPLSFGCVLTFHDAVELFLLLASEHLRVTVPGKGQGFVEKHFAPINAALEAKELTGRKGIGRITDQRNSFKHANLWPSAQAIEGFRADTEVFFQENTPKVFGITYDAIDMADLVRDEKARSLLKQAKSCDSNDQRAKAMAYLRHALHTLLTKKLDEHGHGPFALGGEITMPVRVDTVTHLLNRQERSVYGGVGEKVAKHLEAMTMATQTLQHAIRLLMLGVDLIQYNRFAELTPYAGPVGDDDDIRFVAHPPRPATDEEFTFCQRFVISIALRLNEVEAHLQPPSWKVDAESQIGN